MLILFFVFIFQSVVLVGIAYYYYIDDISALLPSLFRFCEIKIVSKHKDTSYEKCGIQVCLVLLSVKKLQLSYFYITGDILGNTKFTLLGIIIWEVRVPASFFSIIKYLNSQEKRQKKNRESNNVIYYYK